MPDTVAIASDSKNHAPRKRRISFNRRASLTVLHSDAHAYIMYPNQLLFDAPFDGNGGPGRGRKPMAAGIVKVNHHAPMRNNTTRRENVVLFMVKTMRMQTHCKNKPAQYPMPIPFDEILVES